MKKLTVLFLAIALGFGVLGLGSNALATSYDPTGELGSWPVPPTTPMIWNHGQTGDALFGEMYRAVYGAFDDPFNFATYVSIENVSDYWVAAHVRMRSGRYSIEVWDRPILLSPKDVFWFQFYVVPPDDPKNTTGHTQVFITSCDTKTLTYSGLANASGCYTAELSPLLLSQFTTYIADQGLTTEDLYQELTQGYLEVIGLWALPNSVNGYTFAASGHNVKTAMAQLWGDTSLPGNVCWGGTPGYDVGVNYTSDQQFAKACARDVGKYLSGHVFMGDFTNGLYFGYPMKAIYNFRYLPADTPNYGACFRDKWIRPNNAGKVNYRGDLIIYGAYQSDGAYSEPDWATSYGPTLNDGTDYFCTGNGPTDSFSLDDVEDAIFKQYLFADYFNGGFSYNSSTGLGGTFTLATVTFPTKFLHYYYDCQSGLKYEGTDSSCIVEGYYNGAWPVNDASGIKANVVRSYINPASSQFGIKPVSCSADIWDLEERSPRDGSPFAQISLPWEVNFVPIGDLSEKKLYPFCFLTVKDAALFTPFTEAKYANGFASGWFRLNTFQLLSDPRSVYGSGSCSPVLAGSVGGSRDTYTIGYCPQLFTLLGTAGGFILPPSGQIMDWEFTNFSHGRSYEPSWDNPTSDLIEVIRVPDGYPWYGGVVLPE